MKKVTLLLIALFALGLSSCDKVIGQDNKQTFQQTNPEVQIVPITTIELADQANSYQTLSVWKVRDAECIDIYQVCEYGKYVKVREAVLHPDNIYTIYRYDENNLLQPLFKTQFIVANLHVRPQNK